MVRRWTFVYIFFMRQCILLFVCLPLVAARADTDFPRGLAFGVGMSATSGMNIMAGYHNSAYQSYWLRHFGVRIDFASADPLKSALDSAIESYMDDGVDVGDGVKIDEGQLDAWHGGLLLDFYPFANFWRLSTGYIWGGADLSAAVFGEVETAPDSRFYFYLAGDHYYYNGNDFSGSAEINWNYHGPYLGTGVDIGIFCGFELFVDFGAVFAATPAKLKLNIPHEQLYIYNKDTGQWSPVTIPALDADVARATRSANRKLADFKFYPMLKLGFAYRF